MEDDDDGNVQWGVMSKTVKSRGDDTSLIYSIHHIAINSETADYTNENRFVSEIGSNQRSSV